jgi:hypothetical protein
MRTGLIIWYRSNLGILGLKLNDLGFAPKQRKTFSPINF